MYASLQTFVLLSTLCLCRSSTFARNLKPQEVWQEEAGNTEVSLTANGRVEHFKPFPLMRKEAEEKNRGSQSIGEQPEGLRNKPSTISMLRHQDEGQKEDLQEDLEDLKAHSKDAARESDRNLDEDIEDLLNGAAQAKQQHPAEHSSHGSNQDFFEDMEDLSITAAQESQQRKTLLALQDKMPKNKHSRNSLGLVVGHNVVRNSGFDDEANVSYPLWMNSCPSALHNGHLDVVGASCSSQGMYAGLAHNSGSPRANAWGLKSITDCFAGGRGGVYQDIWTTTGVKYQVLFKVIDGFFDKRQTDADLSIVHVEVQSPVTAVVLDHKNSIQGSGIEPATGNWDLIGPLFFTARSETSRIFFFSGSYSCLFIDNVIVQSLTDGSAMTAATTTTTTRPVVVAPVWTESTTIEVTEATISSTTATVNDTVPAEGHSVSSIWTPGVNGTVPAESNSFSSTTIPNVSSTVPAEGNAVSSTTTSTVPAEGNSVSSSTTPKVSSTVPAEGKNTVNPNVSSTVPAERNTVSSTTTLSVSSAVPAEGNGMQDLIDKAVAEHLRVISTTITTTQKTINVSEIVAHTIEKQLEAVARSKSTTLTTTSSNVTDSFSEHERRLFELLKGSSLSPEQIAAAAAASAAKGMMQDAGLVRTTTTLSTASTTTSSATTSTADVGGSDLAKHLATYYGLVPHSNGTPPHHERFGAVSEHMQNLTEEISRLTAAKNESDAEKARAIAELRAELIASREEIKLLKGALANATEKEIREHNATLSNTDEDVDDMMTSFANEDLENLSPQQVALLLFKLKEEIKDKKNELKAQDKILNAAVHRLASGKAMADYVFGVDSAAIPPGGPTPEVIARMAATPKTATEAIKNTVDIVVHSKKTLTAGKKLADEIFGTDTSKLTVHLAEQEVPLCTSEDLKTLYNSMNQSCQQWVGGEVFLGNTLAAGDFLTPMDDMCGCIDIALKVSQLSSKSNDCAPAGLPSLRAQCTIFLGTKVFKRVTQKKVRAPQETLWNATAPEEKQLQQNSYPTSRQEKTPLKPPQENNEALKPTVNNSIRPVKIPNCSLMDLQGLFREMQETCQRQVGTMIFLSNLEGTIHADKGACLCVERAFEGLAHSFPHRDCKPEGLASFKTMCGMELGHAINLDKLFDSGQAEGAGSRALTIPNCNPKDLEILFESMDGQCKGSVGGSLFVSNLIGTMPLGEDFCPCIGHSFLKLGDAFPAHDCSPAGQPSFGTTCALRRHQNKTTNSCCAKFFGAPTETGAHADKCPKPFIYREWLTPEALQGHQLADCVRFDLSQEECGKAGAYWLPERCSNSRAVTGTRGVCSLGDLQVIYGAMNATCKAVVGTPEDMSSPTIVLDEVCPCVGEAMMNLGSEGFDCAPAGRESFSRLCSSDGALRRPIGINQLQPRNLQRQSDLTRLTDLEDHLTQEIDKVSVSSLGNGRAVSNEDFSLKTQLGSRAAGTSGSSQHTLDVDELRQRHRTETKMSPEAIVLLVAFACLCLISAVLAFRFVAPARGDEALLEAEQPAAAEDQPPAAASEAQAAATQQPATDS